MNPRDDLTETLADYDQLVTRYRRLSALSEAAGVLHWDLSTMMPSGGAAARSEQLAMLSVTRHEMITDPSMDDLLTGAEQQAPSLGPWEQANLREMRRVWRHATALDSGLVEAHKKACHRCEQIWRDARPNSDFCAVLPSLEEVLSLTRHVAEAKGREFGCDAYDALLDQYEPGGRAARIDQLFDELANFLPELTQTVLDRQAAQPAPLSPSGPFPESKQAELARRLMTAIGFDFNHGRLDVSRHPFCGGVPDDVRITTRYDEDDFLKALMAVLHETGHALYERGLPETWRLQPVGEARGMALHESQSLLIEMQACRSAEFQRYLAPIAAEAFGGAGPAWTGENLTAIAQRVERGFIRVDADEVTYPAHVILRYRLERALLNGDLTLAELPGAWNDSMRTLLGVVPPNDAMGCLQDIHWYDGAWGYFPTYTLGAMAAAQIFAAAKAARPEIPADIARGDFAPLLTWLRAQVHEQASLSSTDEILEQATGAPLQAAAFEAHLKARYLPD